MWNPAGEFHPTGNPDQTFRLLLLMAIAKKLGARTAIINHSVEITDPHLQALVAHVYRKTDFISVREQPSAERVLALDVPANRVHVAPDLVFLASTSRALNAVPPPNISGGCHRLFDQRPEAGNGSDEWDALLTNLKTLGRPFVFVSNAANHDLQFFPHPRPQAWRHRRRSAAGLSRVAEHLCAARCAREQPPAFLDSRALRRHARRHDRAFRVQGNWNLRAPALPFPTKNVALIGWSKAVVRDIETILARRDEYAQLGHSLMREQVAAIEEQYEAMFSLALNAYGRTRTATSP